MSASRPPSVAALFEEAQRAISKARYDAALELLEQAALLAPEDGEVAQLLAQTERASRRRQAAVERHRAAVDRARGIAALIERDQLETARAQLREAGVELGRHEALLALEQPLAERERAKRRRQASELAGKASTLADAGDWQGALKVAGQSLRLAPNPEAEEIRDRAGAELDRQAEQQQYSRALDTAAGEVERLLEARELAGAGERLRQAIDQLGNHRAFDELDRRINRAKSDLQFRRRVNWAERRANEAEGLISDAARLSLKGSYRQAVDRLEAARELDPSHPDLDDKLKNARAALERQQARRRRTDELARSVAEVRSHLDALRLDDAEQAIRRASEEYGEPERFTSLATRLRHLREVEHSGQALPAAGAPIDRETEAAVLRRQRVLAAAYSWKQTFLYPFRGFGLAAFRVLLAVLVALDVLAAIPRIGVAFDLLGALALLAAVGLLPHVLRATINGRNLLPPWGELAEPARWTRDLLRVGGLLVFACLPLLLLLVTRPWHGAPGTDSGLLVWLAAAILAWFAAAFMVAATGAAEAFGYLHAPRLSRHARSLVAGGSDALLAVDVIFLLGLLVVVLRVVLAPAVPWLLMPVVRVIEVYGLLLAPHLIGILVRRHHVELSKVYG